jgi:hypothetical protein
VRVRSHVQQKVCTPAERGKIHPKQFRVAAGVVSLCAEPVCTNRVDRLCRHVVTLALDLEGQRSWPPILHGMARSGGDQVRGPRFGHRAFKLVANAGVHHNECFRLQFGNSLIQFCAVAAAENKGGIPYASPPQTSSVFRMLSHSPFAASRLRRHAWRGVQIPRGRTWDDNMFCEQRPDPTLWQDPLRRRQYLTRNSTRSTVPRVKPVV